MGAVKIADQSARDQALNTDASYIVQAPAGSGKTGLLTQRFIALLARVNEPEEITAITFTIKAAAEMRNRILQALESAVNEKGPDSGYEKKTWELARTALARDKEKGWHLLENPSRLRIQTIDSLCTSLARQMPLLSQFGSVPAITNNSNDLYMQAAENAIAMLEIGGEWADAVEHLLKHMDNQQNKVQALIVTMLEKRDQWLRHIIHKDNRKLERASLEGSMAGIIEDHLAELSRSMPDHCKAKLLEMAVFAARHLPADSQSKIAELDITNLPGSGLGELAQWEGMADLLLTKSKSKKTGNYWRSQVIKTQGFPAPSEAKEKEEKALYKVRKAEMMELLGELSEHDDFYQQLLLLRELPPQKYTDEEWKTLQALLEVLRLAVTDLALVFKEQGKVDFTELSLAAIRALGEEDSPTDLALALDHQIQHLLVDEFQDTAFNQYDLLKKLTAGWQHDDGRTLFCVGDPMQSIYGFREANVGLFLEAKEKGIGEVKLEFLNLTVNFRSQQGIVEWINQSFPHVMPGQNNASKSAVTYSPSISFHPELEGAAVTVHPALDRDDLLEARQVVSIVKQAKQANPHDTTAIIVRSRSHLVNIIEQLKKAELAFQAVEIEKLAHRPVIQDLLALTCALNHHADRIAWLSVLRAPYCGLTLNDLHVIAGEDLGRTIIDLLNQPQRIAQLSEDGRHRIARVLPVLEAAVSQQARNAQRNTVEGTWLALGGPACVKNATDLKDAEVYFQLLEELTDETSELDLQKLNEQVDRMFALPDVEADGNLQLITLHKAKGLEFDTVILPGLGRPPMSDKSRMLHWLEFGQHASDNDLVLAPISPLGEDKNKTVAYLKFLDNEKRHYEDGRLLYVAATRAKERLHLLGHTKIKEKDDGAIELAPPDQRSLLGSLWPTVKQDFENLFSHYDKEPQQKEEDITATNVCARTRLIQDWRLPLAPESVKTHDDIKEKQVGEQVEFSWAGETARHVGTVVHRFLQRIGELGVDNVTQDDLKNYSGIARTMLMRLGVPVDKLDSATERVNTALQAAIKDEKGQWILSDKHKEASCEFAITGVQDGIAKHMIIDRTFIDEKGMRWIIDYKTGFHSGGGLDEYLDREQERYSSQLEAYASVISRLEDNPVRLAIYFPLMGGWREWVV